MTNAEYILNKLTDRDLALLFTEGSAFYREGTFVHKVQEAFSQWREDTMHKKKNYTDDTDKNHFDLPSVFSWSFIIDDRTNKNKKLPKMRTDSVSFQVFLSEQYNPKYWEYIDE